MRLSIIIPALNEATSIGATLASLQAMRARGVEVVVVDGGSEDATVAIASPLADRIVVSACGRARQMNAGAAGADADVLLFLHADSVLPPDADRLILDALIASPRVWGRFDVKIRGSHRLLPIIASMMNFRSRLSGIATGDQGLFIRRETFQTLGGFADIPLMEDVAICTRLRKISAPICLKQRITTSGRRWEKHGVWRTILLMWCLRLAYFFGANPFALHGRYYRKS